MSLSWQDRWRSKLKLVVVLFWGINWNVCCVLKTGIMTYIIAVIGTPIALCGIFGNLLTIIAVYKTRVLRSRNSVLLTTNLAVIDFLFSVVCMPTAIIRTALDVEHVEAFPDCVFTMFLYLMVVLNSLVTLMFVSIDRYVAIVTPMRYLLVTRSFIKLAIVGTWFWAALVSVSACVRYKMIFYERKIGFCSTGFNNMPSVALVYLTFLCSFTIIGYCYWGIFKQARRHRRQINAMTIGNISDVSSIYRNLVICIYVAKF